jgi:hypothetical protein
VATWAGLRPAREVWTSAVDLRGRASAPGVGDALFAAVANGDLTEADFGATDLRDAVAETSSLLLRRQVTEDAERRAVNDALVLARRASLDSIHRRKIDDLTSRRQALIDKGDSKMARLFEGQIRRERQRFDQLTAELAERAHCGLTTEPLAVCHVQVPS